MPYSSHPDLSERENQILRMAAEGLTDQAIANKLGISLNTVSTYWGRIRIKLGPVNRAELVANFVREQSGDQLERLRYENRQLLAELERHNEAERELQSTLDLFQTLIDTAPDAILVVDATGHIRLVNDEAERTFGYERKEFLELQVVDLMPARFRDAHDGHRQSYLASPTARRMGEAEPTVGLRKDGEEFPIAATLNATHTSSGVLVTCIIRDISRVGWAVRPENVDPEGPS
jgi:PAS domain S-box-containing protein